MAPTPELLATTYDGDLVVGAQWRFIPGVGQYVVTVYSGGAVLGTAVGRGASGSVKLAQPLTSRSCQVAVATDDGARGPDSNRLLIVIDRLTGLTATYDGSTVGASWTAPTPPVNAAALAVLTASGKALAQATVFATTGQLPVPGPLEAGALLRASAAIGTSIGPPVDLPLVAARASIQAVGYDPADGNRVEVLLDPTGPAGAVPQATLRADGAPSVVATGQGTVVRVPLAGPLDPVSAWTVRPAWVAGGATGPPGTAVDVLATAPRLGEVRVEDDGVALSWRSLPGPPYPSGGQVRFSAPGQTTSAAVVTGADGGVCVPAPPLAAGVVYAATVAPLRGRSEGPASLPVRVANVRTPVTSTAYDGRTLTVGWSGADPPGTTGCRVEVLEGTAGIASRTATGGTAVVDVALEPGAAHAVRLRWLTPGGIGPAGPAASVLAATGGVADVAVLPAAILVTVAVPSAAPDVARWVARVYRGDRELAVSTPVATAAAPVATIPFAALGAPGLTVRVQALAADGSPATGGPLGPPAPVLAAGPVITRADLHGTELTVSWDPVEAPAGAATSTTLTVALATGAGPAEFPGLLGTEATVTVPVSLLDPTVGATVTAVAVGPAGASPPGSPCALVVSAPTVTAAAREGGALRVDWAWPAGAAGEATATGYRVDLLAGGVRRGRVTVDGSPALVVPDAPVDPSLVVSVAVDPLAPPASFAADPVLSVPWAAPTLQSATSTADGRIALEFAAAPAAAGAVTGYEAVFTAAGRADVAVALPGTTSPATVALPPPPSDGAFVAEAVALRAIGPAVTGAASGALSVLRAAPVPTEATFDDGRLTVRWSPLPAPVDASAVVATDGTTVVRAATSAAVATLDLPPGDAAWRVDVAGRAGAASGPAAPGPDGQPGVPVLVSPPAVGAIAYDGALLRVAVTPPAAPAPAVTGYRVELVRDGSTVRAVDVAVPAGSEPLAIEVSPDADATVRHAVRVRGRIGIARGPAAAAAPVVLATPLVARAAVGEDAVEVRVDPQGLPATGATWQVALVVDEATGAPVAADAGGRASLPGPPSGATAAAVVARAVYGGTTGAWSDPVPLPLVRPVVQAASYDGATLAVRWSGDPGATHAVSVHAGGTEVARTVVAATATSLAFAPPNDPAEVAVRVLDGPATGPEGRLALVTAAATVTVVAGASDATVAWTLPSGTPAATAVVPVVAGEGTRRELPGVEPAPATTTVPTADLPAGAALGIRVQSGAAAGPASNLAPVVLGAPAGVAVRWAAGTLRATWRAPEDARVDGALVTLSVPDAPDVATRVPGTAWSTPLGADVAGARVTVAATAGHGSGPPAGPVPAIVAAPTITGVTSDGATATLTWTAVTVPDTVSGYLVTVQDGDPVLARRTVTGTTGTVVLPSPAGVLTAAVMAVVGATADPSAPPASTGPRSAAAPIPQASVTDVRLAVDPVSGAATVSWPAATGPGTTGYRAQVVVDGAAVGPPLTTTAPSVVLPTAPTPAARIAVAVAVQATVDGVALDGPYGPQIALPTASPVLRDVAFDGTAATVRWSPVATATGYAVSVVDPEVPAPVATLSVGSDATEARVPVVLPTPTATYSIVVQARFGPSTGVRAHGPLFAPAIVVRATDGPPRVQRAATPQLAAAPAVAYLPPIGTLNPLPIAPTQVGATDVPFTVDVNPDPATATAYPYRLSIDHGALRFDDARSALAATYRELLGLLEERGATPRGVLAVQQAISRLMPQSFDETLFYAYGLSTTDGYVDLRPGTILRVSASAFDLTAVSGAPAWSTGYAGGAVVDLPVDDYVDGGTDGPWLTGFDAFVATLAANGTLTVPAPQSSGGGGVDVVQSGGSEAADLFYADFRRPYHRLLIPGQLQPSTPPGVSRTGQQFTVAAARTWAEIDAATPTPGGGVTLAFFRGRTVLSVCIRVHVDGTERTVPVGTTVGNVLDGLGRRPPSTAVPLAGLRLERSRGAVVLDPSAPFDAAASDRVLLDWGGLVAWGAGRDALSLPLLHGDRLTTGPTP
jgi:hypothetical protein